jgi:hypothetical protein
MLAAVLDLASAVPRGAYECVGEDVETAERVVRIVGG